MRTGKLRARWLHMSVLQEGDIQPPEPSAGHIAQLTDMGFSEVLARKALQLTRNNVEHALDWLLQHSEESGAADPPTQEQLRAVYGRRRRRAAGAAVDAGAAAAGVPVEAVLTQLVDMVSANSALHVVFTRHSTTAVGCLLYRLRSWWVFLCR